MKNIRLILKSVREYKKYAILTPLFMVLEVFMECLLPFTVGKFVDALEKLHSMSDFVAKQPINFGAFTLNISPLILVLSCLGMAILSIIGGIMGGIFASKASTGLAKNLRFDIYKKIQSFSFENIDRFSSSSLITRMTTDVTNTQNAFQMCIRIVVRAPLMLVVSTIMGFISGKRLGWVFIVIIPLIIFGLLFLMSKAMPIFKGVFKKYDALNQTVKENIHGIRVVKSYVRENYEQEKFNNASDSMSNEFIKAEKILAFNNPIMNTAFHLSNILLFSFGSKMIVDGVQKVENIGSKEAEIIWGELSIGKLQSLQTYGVQILGSLMMLSMIVVMLALSLESIRRISEVLREEPTIKNPENPIFEVKDGSVKFENVVFKYNSIAEKNTLEGISLDIKSGEFVGILGSTGSGKSSLVNLISRLYDVTDGTLEVGGINVKNYDLDTLRNNVAVVLQKNVLFSGSIKDNLRWGNIDATDEQMMEACKIAQADEFIQSFPQKYDSRIEQGGSNVSGGQKQRLCIARAILKNPKILILDDSTSAVDTKTDKLIRTALKNKIPNTTKIVIAQRISSIENADKIIVMNDGKIDQIGNHEELLKSNMIYQEVYYTQNKKGGTN